MLFRNSCDGSCGTRGACSGCGQERPFAEAYVLDPVIAWPSDEVVAQEQSNFSARYPVPPCTPTAPAAQTVKELELEQRICQLEAELFRAKLLNRFYQHHLSVHLMGSAYDH